MLISKEYQTGIIVPYLYDTLRGEAIPLVDSYNRKIPIPVLPDKSNKALAHIILKNTSREIAGNIVLTLNGVTHINSVLKPQGEIAAINEYSHLTSFSYVNYPCLKELMPGESVNLFLSYAVAESNIGIDLSLFSIDVAYTRSYIPVTDLITLFEFTEVFGSTTIKDSLTENTTTISSELAKGGFVQFLSGDNIAFTIIRQDEYSLFVKGIFQDCGAMNFIFEIGDYIRFGLNALRQPYFRINSTTITGQSSLDDTLGEHILGFSYSTDSGIIMTIDGDILKTTQTIRHITFIPPEGTISDCKIGSDGVNQFIGILSEFALYSTHKSPAFHKLISERL